MLEGDEISGVVAKVIRKRDDNSVIGLLVDAGLPAFVPRSLMTGEHVEQIDELDGRHVDGVVRIVDEKRRTVVVTPIRFHELAPAKSTDSYLTDEYLQLLVDNIRSHVDPDDNERYLGRENARNILVAIYKHDVGSDADAWQQYISECRKTQILRRMASPTLSPFVHASFRW